MLHKDFLEAFVQIHSYTEYDFKDLKNINRRLCNYIFKAFIKNLNNKIIKDEREIKKTKDSFCQMINIFIEMYL